MVEYDTAHLKMVDFGFSKELKKGRAYTRCGTPEYMAPEVINQKEYSSTETRVSQTSFLSKQSGYGFECDVWSWGVMLCEMIGGFNPFSGSDIQKTFRNIIQLRVNWPKNISQECKRLLESIFVVDPSLRASIFDIKHHPFFKEIQNWRDLDPTLPP